MVAARNGDRHIELPRGLHVRVHLAASAGGGAGVTAIVRKIEPDRVTLGLTDLPAGVEQLRGGPVTLSAQLHGRAYAMDATVLDIEDAPPALILTTPQEARRAERRRLYRLNTSIDARGSWTEVDEASDSRPVIHRLEPVRLLDISGGGALLRTPVWTPARVLIRLEFGLEGDPQSLTIDARALRVEEEARTRAYRINTEFEGISHRTQEQIVRFIFRQQTLLSRRRNQ